MGKLQAVALPAPTLSKTVQKSSHPRVLQGQVSTEKTKPVGSSCPIQLAIGLNSYNNFNIQKEFSNKGIDIQLHPKFFTVWTTPLERMIKELPMNVFMKM